MRAPLLVPPAAELVAEMNRAVRGEREVAEPAWTALVMDLLESNLRQWDLEDVTRDPSASDAVVANAKREIDLLNIGRHQLVQKIDAAIESALDQPATALLATESPGMVLDRLSVLVIRWVRTAAASADRPDYAARAVNLESRVAALSLAFDLYMDELRVGTRRFLPYEHLKLYGPASSAEE